jgi:alpha-galactosidase
MAEVPMPDEAFLLHDDTDAPSRARRAGTGFATTDVAVELTPADGGLAVHLICPHRGLSLVALRWLAPVPDRTLILGDAWERSYGDLQWRHRQPDRVMPWYWLGHDPATGGTQGMGVRVRPAAFCSWSLDEDGITLWLDVRSGAAAVALGPRRLHAATVVRSHADADASPFAVLTELCRAMCDDPVLPGEAVVGSNNWYYTYGRDFGPSEVLRDAETIVALADGHPVRPYCVVDAGWSLGGECPGGPWTSGIPGLFDDMPSLADGIAARGARPGIWFRPAALTFVDDPARLRSGPRPVPEQPLDLSLPDNLRTIGEDVRRLVGWGFELIKHDFSTYDHFARWGFQMGRKLTEPGWALADPTVTNAEVLLNLYRTIREAAGDALVLGCNTVGHLAAGLVQVQRTGDDTSGRFWERTRRMGVNTLAFRLAQHRTFFAVDADCVPCTPATSWERNRRFLDLVARSGTALFVSVDPKSRTRDVDDDLRAAVKIALDGGEPAGVEPLDWLHTTSPRDWRIGRDRTRYRWLEPYGAGNQMDGTDLLAP